MTNTQKEQIRQMRQSGRSYGDIGGELGLSRDAVKSFCRRNNIAAGENDRPQPTDTFNREKPGTDRCRECGIPIVQKPKMKRQVFCCRECRIRWWRQHPEELKGNGTYSYICAGCGKHFTAYGNPNRKYCSHACYVRMRFRGGERHE